MRWPWTQDSAANSLSTAFDAAPLRANELSTTDGAFALLRNNPEGRPLAATDAQAEFRMTGAAANLISKEGSSEAVSPVAVNSGRLSVDFSRATYNTQLNVSNERMGSQDLNASGAIQANGTLTGASGSMGTRGTFSTDGREAGYFFSGNLPAGQVRGITLWGR